MIIHRSQQRVINAELHGIEARIRTHTALTFVINTEEFYTTACISGLLGNIEVTKERLLERDLRIGDDSFDDTVFWQVSGLSSHGHPRDNDFLSRLDASTRLKLAGLVQRGVRIEFGAIHLPIMMNRKLLKTEEQLTSFLDDIASVARSFAHKTMDDTTVIDRLTKLTLTDPVMPFRRKLLERLLATLETDRACRRSVLEQLITQTTESPMNEEAAIQALQNPSHISALAAIYWLNDYGTKAAMQPIAYAMNTPSASSELITAASKVLAFFEVRYGKLSTGVLSMVEPNQAGTLSIHERTGQLSEAHLKQKA
jgi:hypothetical protein